MKKITKFLVTVSLVTAVCATPVMAAGINDLSAPPTVQQLQALEAQQAAIVNAQLADLIKKANGNPEGPQWSNHIAQVQNNLQKLYAEGGKIYVNNLKDIVNSKKTIEASRKQAVDSLTALVSVNPGFAPALEQAQAEYQKAVLETAQAQQNLAAAQLVYGTY